MEKGKKVRQLNHASGRRGKKNEDRRKYHILGVLAEGTKGRHYAGRTMTTTRRNT